MTEHKYNKNNPLMASIKERYSLCGENSHKDTQHIVIDLQGSGLSYQVGDSLAIFPRNEAPAIENTIRAMNATGKEIVFDRMNREWMLRDFLSAHVNITEVSRKLLSEIHARQTSAQKKEVLGHLHAEGNKEQLKEFLATHHLYDILQAHEEVIFSPQELCQLLMPLLPRFYSIASSSVAVGEEIHLTVALLKYQSNGMVRTGVCTQYLCNTAPLNEATIPVYVQPHHGFTLPHDDAPIIMVGPGTGVAPFRAFMQERFTREAKGKNWLFFGECNRTSNFFYETFWQDLVDRDFLQLDVAFSRDQEHKIYVQHKMLERGEEIFRWIDAGAYFFVCGDASRMAKDVEATLLEIIRTHGNKDEEAAKHYLKQLRAQKRYLRDVY